MKEWSSEKYNLKWENVYSMTGFYGATTATKKKLRQKKCGEQHKISIT